MSICLLFFCNVSNSLLRLPKESIGLPVKQPIPRIQAGILPEQSFSQNGKKKDKELFNEMTISLPKIWPL